MFYEVIPEGKVEALTYDFGDSLLPGQIVIVPVGRRTVPGIVVKKVAQPNFKTKSISKVLYSKPLPRRLLKTISFIHDYYLTTSGEAVSLILPRGVQKKRRIPVNSLDGSCRTFSSPTSLTLSGGGAPGPSPVHDKTEQMFGDAIKTEQRPVMPEIQLNMAQKKALEGLQKAPGATKLLYGVTGSGKTNIYLKMASRALLAQKSTILLVPEIALTGQLVRVFREYFSEKVVLIHSKQTEAERHLIFDSILSAKKPLMVVGPRSALFAPLADLGLIIIDEAHEATYVQENTPRYSAIRVASFMANQVKCPLILGSATPTVADFYIAEKQGAVIELTEKAKSTAVKPKIEIIDFKNRDNFAKNKYFSNSLLKSMAANLEAGRQTLIFHNRRGSSPLTICENCGQEILCPSCFLPLNLHADSYELKCHTCDFKMNVPASCPKCGAPSLIHKGFGTKLLETEAKRLFPKARIKRFDADNKKDESLNILYPEVKSGEIDILIGTQTVAKGLDLPKLATVGVMQADAGLNLPDFAAEEKAFQLLTQVIGRVGRGHLDKAEVFVQTYQPEHPVLKFAIEENYLKFYEYLINKRRKANFPPFKFIAKLTITMKTEATVIKKIRELTQILKTDSRLMVSSPQPAFHEHTARGYTWQIILRSRSRKVLLEVCSSLDKNFKITLDPPSLL